MSKYIASKNQNLLSTSLDSKSPNVWWCTPVIPALVRLRLEDCKFEASLDYKVRLCFKKKKKTPLWTSVSLPGKWEKRGIGIKSCSLPREALRGEGFPVREDLRPGQCDH
jgi:hypothetical protein